MSSEQSDSEIEDVIPDDVLETAKNITLQLLPAQSKRQYVKAYNEFKSWRKTKKTTLFSEEILLVYFDMLSKTVAPSTAWSKYSMLKTTIRTFDNIDISEYKNLLALLKRNSTGHQSKKSKVFTSAQISTFNNEAPDNNFLVTKVAMIMGITGACRREELCNMTMKDIEDHHTMLLVKIPRTKTNIQRSFTVVGDFYHVCKKYMSLRPKDSKCDRFFLNQKNQKCTQQPIEINKLGGMPKMIATFLQLPDPDQYTGHSFRRTSATLLVEAGADITTSKRHGGWKSDTVAEGYVESSINNKKLIGEKITSSLTIHPPTSTMTADGITPMPRCKRYNIVEDVQQLGINPSTSAKNTELEATVPKRIRYDNNSVNERLAPIPAALIPPDTPDPNCVSVNNNCAALTTTNTTTMSKDLVSFQFNNCSVTITMCNAGKK